MTAQIGEKLIYDGRQVSMCSEPLGDYFAFGGRNPEFESNCTALWRGYVGTWEIVGDRLDIVSLSGTLKDGTEATLETVFPGYPDRVFAHISPVDSPSGVLARIVADAQLVADDHGVLGILPPNIAKTAAGRASCGFWRPITYRLSAGSHQSIPLNPQVLAIHLSVRMCIYPGG